MDKAMKGKIDAITHKIKELNSLGLEDDIIEDAREFLEIEQSEKDGETVSSF